MDKRRNRKIISRPPTSHSRAVVLHTHPIAIRRYYIKSYRTQVSSLNAASEKMRQFIEVDQPAFTMWWQQEFAEELTEQFQLERTCHEMSILIEAVEAYKAHHGCNYNKAYMVVAKAQADGRLGELLNELYASEAEAEAEDADFFEAFERAFRERAESEDKNSGSKQQKASAQASSRRAGASAADTTDGYLKKLYHDLVLQLHPDSKPGTEQTAQEKVLWQELQHAYAWRDLDRLEGIFRTLKGRASAVLDFAAIPIADIIAMRAEVTKKLNQLRDQIKRAKKEANWDFQNRRKKPSFLQMMRQSIESELVENTMLLQFEKSRLEKRIKTWTQGVRNRKQRSSRREEELDRHA